MFDTITVKIAQRGLITLPKAWRSAYHLKPGDEMTFLDIGGVFVLTPRRSQIDALAQRVTNEFVRQGETLESMLQALREERERYDENS